MILKVKDNNGNWVEVPALVGNGISSISKTSGTSLPGSTDTYTISYTNGTTSTFQVYNGQDGQGTGDMLMSIYDTDKDGIVDNAEKVNNHTVNADVPSNAKFTDTTYSAMTLDDLSSGSTEKRVVTAEFLGSVLGDSITYYNSSDLNNDVYLDWTLGDTTEE